MKYRFFSLICIVFFFTNQMAAEDGSLLWLRQSQGANASVEVSAQCTSATLNLAAEELRQSWKGNPVALLIEKDKQLAPDGFRIQCTEKKLVWSLSPAPPARKRTAHPSLHGESGLQPSHPQPLGQHGPNRRARLCRTVALGLGRTARHILRQI